MSYSYLKKLSLIISCFCIANIAYATTNTDKTPILGYIEYIGWFFVIIGIILLFDNEIILFISCLLIGVFFLSLSNNPLFSFIIFCAFLIFFIVREFIATMEQREREYEKAKEQKKRECEQKEFKKWLIENEYNEELYHIFENMESIEEYDETNYDVNYVHNAFEKFIEIKQEIIQGILPSHSDLEIFRILRKVVISEENAEIYHKNQAEKILNFEKFLLEKNYMQVLIKKRHELVYKDDYGHEIFDDFFKELKKFIKIVSSEVVNIYKYHSIDEIKLILFDIIERNYKMVVKEYEVFIFNIIKTKGWDAKVVKTNGDQFDIIATLNQITILVRCKFSTLPVDNHAVQQVEVTKNRYMATHAIMVSNSVYTKSAKELAYSYDIKLLHHNELNDYLSSLN